MNLNTLSPIVLFVYNRLQHTRQTIEALQNNDLAQESELFIYSDGAKVESDQAKINEVRDFIRGVQGFKRVTIIEHGHNKGLAGSIIDGVTELVNKYGRLIVLEDDIVTSPFFLSYMNDALEFFKDEPKVMHLAGYMFPLKTEGLKEAFFLYPSTCWGWGTWSRAWQYFEKNPSKLINRFNKKMIKDFNLDNTYDYWIQVKLNLEGRINSWAIFWQASIFLNEGLSLHPKKSFVRNIGNDGSGEHCRMTDVFDGNLSNSYPIDFSVIPVKIDESANARLKDYFKSTQPRLMTKVLRKISSITRRIFRNA